MVNAQKIKRENERQQRRALKDLNANFNHARPSQGRNTTSNGVRQVVSLEKLEGVAKSVTVMDGELIITIRLKHDGREALRLIQLLKEIDGWVWNG